MRTTYYEELSALSAQVGEMCGLAADAMEHATQALLGADLSLAEQVIADHEHIVEMSKETESNAIKLLALQQPVAGDLRTIVSAIHVGADIERMGALAVHVATHRAASASRMRPARRGARELLRNGYQGSRIGQNGTGSAAVARSTEGGTPT